jgi:hypothetical protein
LPAKVIEKNHTSKDKKKKIKKIKKISKWGNAYIQPQKKGRGCGIFKYFLYLCNAGREQKPAKKQKSYKP